MERQTDDYRCPLCTEAQSKVTAQYNAERQSKGYVWRSVCRECNMPTPIPSMTPEDRNQAVRRMTQTQPRRLRVWETTTPTHQEQQQSTDEVEALNDQISKIDRQVRELGSAAPVTAKQTSSLSRKWRRNSCASSCLPLWKALFTLVMLLKHQRGLVGHPGFQADCTCFSKSHSKHCLLRQPLECSPASSRSRRGGVWARHCRTAFW